ncbi:hypothetical protein [Bacteroides sp.]|uniref:hypothetical protein n=1 Tax=Bacteroides sp. TaxID=29523 RepID=UPI00260296F8|nr:hypothetical protein [Bacteroides sp.]MDD3041294.1 hypothetical protein [Bacteroides sp.]
MAPNFKGSQINGGNSDYGRVGSDFYPTPPEATQALIDFLGIPKGRVIWEPACGEGHMSEVLVRNGYTVISTDLNECCGTSGIDFTTADLTPCDWIITNPPFNLAEQFIRKAWSFEKPFALLLKSQYWHSKKRYPLFRECTPSFILPLTWRPDFMFKTRGSGSPLMDVMWCVWNESSSDGVEYIPLERPKTVA